MVLSIEDPLSNFRHMPVVKCLLGSPGWMEKDDYIWIPIMVGHAGTDALANSNWLRGTGAHGDIKFEYGKPSDATINRIVSELGVEKVWAGAWDCSIQGPSCASFLDITDPATGSPIPFDADGTGAANDGGAAWFKCADAPRYRMQSAGSPNGVVNMEWLGGDTPDAATSFVNRKATAAGASSFWGVDCSRADNGAVVMKASGSGAHCYFNSGAVGGWRFLMFLLVPK